MVFLAAACGDDGDDGTIDAAGGGIDAADTVDAPTGIDADPNAPDADEPDAMVGTAPTISEIAWEPVGACTEDTQSGMMITTTATDTETPNQLTYSGSVSSCTGTINAATATVSCPQVAPYNGSVTVTDGDGNSTTESFSFGPCETGSATF